MSTICHQTDYSEALDQLLQNITCDPNSGISPTAWLIAFFDWYFHLLIHPAEQMELLKLSQENFWSLYQKYLTHITALSDTDNKNASMKSFQDKRFVDKSWEIFPYSFYYESFLVVENWWHEAIVKVRGISPHHAKVIDFSLRQFLDILSPSNAIFTNPEISKTAQLEYGLNFLRGFNHFLEDLKRYQTKQLPKGIEQFKLGKNIAATPGKVIYRNRLIELIQYSPMTETVYAEPILITPAWIMKYYILDLSPNNSLVKYLVKKGHTVFIISWKNPTSEDRDLSMEDYLNFGIFSAMDVISYIVPKQKIHLIGYCLGGTLAAIAAAAMARDKDHRLATLTIIAAQTDFTEPGELGVFIDESQISYLENIMSQQGYLDSYQMAGAFQLIRSNDLIWSRIIREYLLGERKPLTDLMAWNADATRLPYKMHSEYLRQLFLHNDLAEGRYRVKNRAITLTDINVPLFVVATENDQISPWQSVFKINLLTSVDVIFNLVSGGHNVGIVTTPSVKTRSYYRCALIGTADEYIEPDNWFEHTSPKTGSWWTPYEKWLVTKSGQKCAPPEMGAANLGYEVLEDAPGTYIFQR